MAQEKNGQNGNQLVVGVSSQALFDMRESHEVYQKKGTAKYEKYQRDNENVKLNPGKAFSLVEKLLGLNQFAKGGDPLVEVILLSRNSADTGLRAFNSIEKYRLNIRRAAFCSGQSPYRYMDSFGCHLFLTTDRDDVQRALDEGKAAAEILYASGEGKQNKSCLKFAFDADAVIFSDAAEQVFQEGGLDEFRKHESKKANKPLPAGPFAGFLHALHHLQEALGKNADDCLRTAIFTARGAPAHERVIRTLRSWGISVDEILFLEGREKGPFLRDYGADIFIDDQKKHCDSAMEHGISTVHLNLNG